MSKLIINTFERDLFQILLIFINVKSSYERDAISSIVFN